LGIMTVMDKKAELENALKAAMRSGDEIRKRTLRMAISAVRMAEIEKGEPLSDSAVMSILQKELKSRQETIEEAKRANRMDLAESTSEEVSVLETFLPQQMSAQELEGLVRQAIQETGASSPADMGRVMKTLMPRLQGRATGDQTSAAVRRLLA
jgi:uncharacterized protein